jgi:hypothetical protein
MRTNINFRSHLTQFITKRRTFQTKLVGKIKTHFMFCNGFPQKSCLYDKMWKNILVRGKPQMSIWTPKATHTQTQYVQHVTGGEISLVKTSCAGRQTDITQITITCVMVMQTTGTFMDAGRGERKTDNTSG